MPITGYEGGAESSVAPVALTRPRLLKRLAEHPDRTILISAPCGYGKSILLDQWIAADPRPVVRLALGRAHDDASLLAGSLVEALWGGGSWPREIAAAIAVGATDFHGEVLARFLTDVAARRGSFVLALDDVANVRRPESTRVLEALSRAMPSGSQLALSSRLDPSIRLGRLRANRLLTEVRRADLTMTKDECAAVLAQMGVRLSSGRLDAVLQRTEGWPAAIYLLALAIRGCADQTRALARFSGADPLIADYMREELLGSLADGQREFLRRISPLERVSGRLCDAVLDRSDSDQVIQGLAGVNVLRALDHRGEWFRLHPLLRGLLQTELHRHDPGAERAIHARASAWWGPEGFADFAMHHAAEAGQAEPAGELFWKMAPDYVVRGNAPTMIGWLRRIGEPAVASSAGLSLTRSWCAISLGSGPEAQHWASVARDLMGPDAISREDSSLAAGLSLLDAALARRGISEMVESAVRVDEHLRDGSPWRSARCLLLGVGAQLRGEAGAARTQLEDGAHRSAFGAPLFEALCRSQLVLAALDLDDSAAAGAEAARARAQVEHDGLPGCPIAALVFAASACALAAQGTFDRAGADLRTAESLLGQLEDFATWYEVETRVLLARAHAGIGHRREANEHLAAAASQASRVPDAPVLDRWIDEASQALSRLGSAAVEVLTPAELRVLQLLPAHMSLPQIAESLCVSPNTVKTHTRNIYAKFGVSSRRAALAEAERHGLLGQPSPALSLS